MRTKVAKYALVGLMALTWCAALPQAEAGLASIKSTGMAGTATAFPLDSICIAYNPAGITELQDRLDFGALWDHSPESATISGNKAPIPHVNGHYNAARCHDFYLAEGGILKHLGNKIVVGLAVYNRDFNKTTFTKAVPLLGTSPLGAEYAHEVASAACAMKVLPYLSVGVMLNYHLQRAKLNGVENFATPALSSKPHNVTNRGYNYSTGWGYGVGALWNVTRCLNLAASYQPKAHTTAFNKYSGFLAEKGHINIPDIFTAGISFRAWQSLTFAFDYQHVGWEKIASLHNRLVVPNPLKAGYKKHLLGAAKGSGFGFKSQSYLRFGVNWDCCDWLTLRAGFRHVNTPVRNSQAAANLLTCDVLENVATFGATWNMLCGNELSFLYAHGFEHTVHGKDALPASFGGGNVNLRQQKNVFGITWGKKF